MKEMADTCSICLDEFKEGETVRVLPCDHGELVHTTLLFWLVSLSEAGNENVIHTTQCKGQFGGDSSKVSCLVFHPKCVDEWLKKWNRTCPLCKSTIKRRGGRTQNPPAQTDENESSLLLPQSRAASQGNDDHADGESPNYGATAVTTRTRGRGQQHRRGGSGSSSGSGASHRNQVTSAEIELNADSNPGRLSSPLSLYHTPLHSDEEEQTPSYATANSGHVSVSFQSASTEQV